MSSIGGRSTGWRSSLETNPNQSLGSFVGQVLLAGGAIVLIAVALVLLSGVS
jgi:hypothetical protein